MIRFPLLRRSAVPSCSRRAWRAASSLVVAGIGCGDATEPRAEPRPTGAEIRVVSGANVSDTISAYIAQPLVVQVYDTQARPAIGVVVAFSWDIAHGVPDAEVGRTPGPASRSVVTTSSDGLGRASAYVRLPRQAGDVRLIVSARMPGMLPLVDTATYVVRPGAPARVLALPRDTAVLLGGTTRLRSTVADRGGNPVSGTVTHVALSPSVAMRADGVVAGVAFGRAAVVARAGAWTDTAWVSAVPDGTIAVRATPGALSNDTALAVFRLRLDGSDYRSVVADPSSRWSTPGPLDDPVGSALLPRWDVAGARVLFHAPDNRLYIADAVGGVHRALGASPLVEETWPTISPDGAWIYFTGRLPTDEFGYERGPHLWRARADGTGAQPLAAAIPAPVAPDPILATPVEWELHGALAPDGARIAYTMQSPSERDFVRVRVRDVATGVRTPLDLYGHSPRWSPDGGRLVYIRGTDYGAVHVVRPDGSGDRLVAPSPYYGPVEWTGDGRYVIAKPYYGVLEVIDVETGVRVPLPFSRDLSAPAWRPGGSER